ncbi:androgen-induced gene 1 protein-like [Cimex lectularius]|uniref:Uncharacterized protein n=1 Tax=Cimex lectularius TaxID=79782 RepID=A0A8I6SIH1_CIMLE|nr:androgen-induced gene 1 protein-like [Cimex lectularius]
MEVEFESKHRLAYLNISTLVHIGGLLNFSAATSLRIYHDISNPNKDLYLKFGYSFKYVSTLNAVVQSIYFLIALIVDIMISCSYTMDAPPRWLMVRSFYRSAIAIPYGSYTCVTFWIFIWYDVGLMADSGPKWTRHIIYTSNTLFLLLDVIFCKGESVRIGTALIVMHIPCTLYFIWLHILYHFTGVWAVSVLKHLTLVERLILYVFNVLEVYLSFVIGKILNDFLWDENFVSRIPIFRNFVTAPPRFIFGQPSTESAKFRQFLSRTESLLVDRPRKKKKKETNRTPVEP